MLRHLPCTGITGARPSLLASMYGGPWSLLHLCQTAHHTGKGRNTVAPSPSLSPLHREWSKQLSLCRFLRVWTTCTHTVKSSTRTSSLRTSCCAWSRSPACALQRAHHTSFWAMWLQWRIAQVFSQNAYYRKNVSRHRFLPCCIVESHASGLRSHYKCILFCLFSTETRKFNLDKITVKIADLGSSCWVVRNTHHSHTV